MRMIFPGQPCAKRVRGFASVTLKGARYYPTIYQWANARRRDADFIDWIRGLRL